MYLCLFNIYANAENPGINDLQSRDFWDQILVRDPEIRVSANIFVFVRKVPEIGKSLQYTMYNRGERTEPWGTPTFSSMRLDRLLCTFTLQDLLDRKEDINLTNLRLSPMLKSF
jgi:hypothetical protein